MGDTMRPISLQELLSRAFGEFRAKGSIFDIPEDHFHSSHLSTRARIFGSNAGTPIGPAAGPHTQLAQNILASYLAGGRYFELKTVQILDTLEIEKPCIDARDEGYNVEWSSEFTLDKAFEEYLKAWFLLNLFDRGRHGGNGDTRSFLFNMSVGYDLEGITSERMDRFINRLIDSTGEELFDGYRGIIAGIDPALAAGTPFAEGFAGVRETAEGISGKICGSVTLSTMHGCPPGEIEAICEHMIVEKKLDTLVKLNPTLLGFEHVREILDGLGYDYVSLGREGFEHDLQFGDAVPMLERLMALAEKQGRFFGVKLTNTLATANIDGVLPGEEKYLSGRALYPITIQLAAVLAEEFEGNLPMSLSGGVSAWNVADVIESGIRPVTVATELLRPGGYGRLKEMAEIVDRNAGCWLMERIDTARVREAATAALRAGYAQKVFRGFEPVAVDAPLPLFDCFVAPCIQACPIHQDVPEYIHLTGEGRYEEAFAVIYEKNPLPFFTGYLCDHACQKNCTRLDWEGAIRIREIKRIAAEAGYEAYRSSDSHIKRKGAPRGSKVAVVGAGPAGLSVSSFLAREGFEVHVFEREEEPGGIIRHVIPEFRVPSHVVEKEVSLLEDLGVVFHYGRDAGSLQVQALKADGFLYVCVGIGAEVDRDIGVDGALPVLDFLRSYRGKGDTLDIGPSVAVIGAGDTAMDAARAAKRCQGVEKVAVIYRRDADQMPALAEEYEAAWEEGVDFHFLRSPAGWDGEGRLVCTVMSLGEPDAGGRPRPEPTERTEVFYVDTVITAVGEDVDRKILEEMGIGDPDRMAEQGVFLIGDASTGASTIVKAIASARSAADRIIAREDGAAFRPFTSDVEKHTPLRSRRDRITPASTAELDDQVVASIESHRCLGCRELCLKCVEVCPNRANTMIEGAGKGAGQGENRVDRYQIVHLDAFCNECGNCETFCPWNGSPYTDKFTIFSSLEDFDDSGNPGIYLDDGRGTLRSGSTTAQFTVDFESGTVAGIADSDIAGLVETIVQGYRYLLGPVEE